jgi:hypothetical protein
MRRRVDSQTYLGLVSDTKNPKIGIEQGEQILRLGDDEPRRVLARRVGVDESSGVQSLEVRESLDVGRDGFAQKTTELSKGECDAVAVVSVGVERYEAPELAKCGERDRHGRADAHVSQVSGKRRQLRHHDRRGWTHTT